MTLASNQEFSDEASLPAFNRLRRERDQLMLLHEALADVERASTRDDRLRALVHALRRYGYGRVDVIEDDSTPLGARVTEWVGRSAVLESNELLVPMRAVDGTDVATLILGEPEHAGRPTQARVKAIELFAQQVASILENARRYEESLQSEARYRNLFDSATDAIYTLDIQGSFTSVNEATCLISGRSRDELLGRSPLAFVAPADGATIKEMLRSALSGTGRRFECHFVRADGTRRIASVTNTPIRHGTQVIGILGVARDITDERERAIALQRSETRYTHLVESASDAIFTVDSTGMLTSVNRALERASGRERAVLLGTPVTELVDVRDQLLMSDALRETLEGGRRLVELRYPDSDGDSRLCSLTLTPIADDIVSGALGVVRDITDERRLTVQLVQQEKLAAVGQLVSGVAHELNNPLASVMAFAQLLLAAPPGASHDLRALEAIHQEARRAAKIVSNLLTFARQHQPERRVTDLNRVVEDTLELRRYALRNAHVEVEIDLDAELPITLADPFQLQQVLLNLLINAEQALASRKGDRSIRVSTSSYENQLVIRVADNGPGVSPDHANRIFNPFFTTKPVGEGTGLGLSISDGIVREHGGRIRVESVPGAGAAFLVEIPIVSPLMPGEPAKAPVITPSSARRRILLVEDEPALRQAVTAYFASLGHAVDAVGTGREAVIQLSSFDYDAVLLDLRLPDISGDEVLRLAGREPGRVVFITGDTQSDAARAVLEATGHPTVSKPFLLDELAAIVLAEHAA